MIVIFFQLFNFYDGMTKIFLIIWHFFIKKKWKKMLNQQFFHFYI